YFVGCQDWGWSVWSHNLDCTHQQLNDELGRAGLPKLEGRTPNKLTEALNGNGEALLRYLIDCGRFTPEQTNALMTVVHRIETGAHLLPAFTRPLGPDGLPLPYKIPKNEQALPDLSHPLNFKLQDRSPTVEAKVLEYSLKVNDWLAEVGPVKAVATGK